MAAHSSRALRGVRPTFEVFQRQQQQPRHREIQHRDDDERSECVEGSAANDVSRFIYRFLRNPPADYSLAPNPSQSYGVPAAQGSIQQPPRPSRHVHSF